ncbi:MAG: hypothetical protein ABIX36_17240 [Mucilaginibacter sp.]
MNCYSIDIEKHAINKLIDYISRIYDLEVICWTVKPETAVTEFVLLKNVDIVFTGINLPEISELNLIKQLPKPG